MPAFYDASCPKCKKRFGWSGESKDRPPCPKCGHQLPPEELVESDEEIEAFKKILRQIKEEKK